MVGKRAELADLVVRNVAHRRLGHTSQTEVCKLRDSGPQPAWRYILFDFQVL